MRKVPFISPNNISEASVLPNNDYRVSLVERMQMPARTHQQEQIPKTDDGGAEPAPEQETEKTITNSSESSEGTANQEASATFEEVGNNDFEDDAAKRIEELVTENPEELAEILVELGNVARIIWGPGLYEGLMYPGQERNDVREVIRKSIINEKDNKTPTEGFNNYEKRLYDKWPKLQEAIQNISFNDEQIKKLAKYIGQDIARVGVPQWVNNHRWVFYWIALEMSKSKNIIQGRAGDMFAKKFGM